MNRRQQALELLHRFKETGSIEDRNRLVEFHMPLARDCAWRKWLALGSPGNIDVDELINVASARLIRVAELFDVNFGSEFSTYAYRAMKAAMFRNISEQLGYTPSGRHCRKNVIKAAHPHISIQAMQEQRGNRGWEPPDPHAEDPTEFHPTAAWVAGLSKYLRPRDRKILMLRYVDGLTLLQVGEKLKISRERVRQLEDRIIRQLQRLTESQLLLERPSKRRRRPIND